MPFINVEIKAYCPDLDRAREVLTQNHAEFVGLDHQTDTYFNVPEGRLKLREGNIENNLIYYKREDRRGPKDSVFHLIPVSDPAGFKELMAKAYGIKVIVRKKREIYYIDNVKIHLDEVPGLGSFVEIEAGNLKAENTKNELKDQCEFYLSEMGMRSAELVSGSYSDMLLDKMPTG